MLWRRNASSQVKTGFQTTVLPKREEGTSDYHALGMCPLFQFLKEFTDFHETSHYHHTTGKHHNAVFIIS
jgi:hypothetical protein